MKTTLFLAFLALGTIPATALAQSSGTPGSSEITPSTGGTSGSTGSETSGSSAGSQTETPNIHGSTSGGGSSQQAEPPMGSNMTCFSPAPLGGPGSFACYPTEQMGGWGMGGMMGMDGLMGWHHHMHMMNGVEHSHDDRNSPNWYYQDRQSYGGKRYYDRNRGNDSGRQFDDDRRSRGDDNAEEDGQQQ